MRAAEFINSKILTNESVTGRDMLKLFRKMHHDKAKNPEMDDYILAHTWDLVTLQPKDIPSEEELWDRDDPFNRIIDIDADAVKAHAKMLKSGNYDPVILGPDGSIIDGNHRAQAAKAMNMPIKAYRPVAINEGPVWDKVKRTAAAGAVATGLGYAALTGQPADKSAQANIELTPAVTVVNKDKTDSQIAKPIAPDEEETPSTANSVDPAREKMIFLAAYRSGIKGHELAQFMAQVAHETLGFQRMVEVGSKDYFKRYDPKHNPGKAKILGNVKPGDGERYKGRGFLQITGRDNYRRAGQALGLPLEKKPELASDPEVAAKIAVWYWKSRVRPNIGDWTDTIGVTSTINPNMSGLGDRDLNYRSYSKRLKLAAQ